MTDEMSPAPTTSAVSRNELSTATTVTALGSVAVVMEPRCMRVVLEGEIDAALGTDLLEASADAEDAGRPIEVDVERVTFMDSTGVAFLARLASRSTERLLLLRPPALVKFLIEVTSISQVLTVVEGPDDEGGPDDLTA